MLAHHSEEENGTGTITQRNDDFFAKHFLRNDPVLHNCFCEELVRFVCVLSADKRTIENELEQSVIVEQRQASCVDLFHQEIRGLLINHSIKKSGST